MAKKKNKKAGKKKTTRTPAKKRPIKRKKNQISEDIIFDSQVGKTDALFVLAPEKEISQPELPPPQKKNFWEKISFFKK